MNELNEQTDSKLIKGLTLYLESNMGISEDYMNRLLSIAEKLAEYESREILNKQVY